MNSHLYNGGGKPVPKAHPPAVPMLRAYLHADRGPQQNRQAFGVAVVVTDGSFQDLFAGHGYASDGDFPRLAAVHYLLSHYPENAVQTHTVGLTDKLGHWRRGNGLTSGGAKFVGHEYLPAVAEAIDLGRLRLLAPPLNFTPEFEKAKAAARAARKDLEGRPDTLARPEVVMNPNAILVLREVATGSQ